MTSSDSKVAKIQTHFQTLSEVATALNAASDELTKTVAILDDSLKKLNVGLVAWVTFRSHDDYDYPETYDNEQIGYCKVNGVWGIALRHVWGDHSTDHHGQDGPWLFNDASREMRVSSVDKIPEVIEALAKEALNTTKKIVEKANEVLQLATAIRPAATEVKGGKMSDLAQVARGVAGHNPAIPLSVLGKSTEGRK